MTSTSVAEFYGRRVALYDRIATAPGIGQWRRRAARRVTRTGSTVVEMGCGTGANLPYLQREVGADGYVLGIDLAGPLLDRARTLTDEYENVEVVRADASRPPIEAEAVDGVLGTFVCGFFSDPAMVIDRWCELLSPGGRIGLLDATASESPFGRPLNPAFRAFVAAGSPGREIGDVVRAPFGDVDAALSRRVEGARTALTDRTVERQYETFGLGFVGLLTGTVEDEDGS